MTNSVKRPKIPSRTLNPKGEFSYGISPDDPLAQTLISHSGSSSDENEDPEREMDDSEVAGIDPELYLSSQFYTFNRDSHHLMVRCVRESRYPSPEEIRVSTPGSVLTSWRIVWKDRNEDTAYSTGWKRIQDKVDTGVDEFGNDVLFFKTNPQQFVPHVNQWREIVGTCHADGLESKHLGVKETIERIKQVWTVGAKFYGIPEAFVRACVSNCAVCQCGVSKSKRRRFEYTDTFEVLTKEVPQRLQQLAAKHKVVLCIRQKYVRNKPFMAEVKDYCCHRAGEPNMKKTGLLQGKRYNSKRCGCGFRIRAIVPIKNYNHKNKSFSYDDDRKAVFNLYAVHSGHEPGPHEGSARIIHRFVGPANLAIERGGIVHVGEDGEEGESISVIDNDEKDTRLAVFRQIEELKAEIGSVVARMPSLSEGALTMLSGELSGISQRIRCIGDVSAAMGPDKEHQGNVLFDVQGDVSDWDSRAEGNISGAANLIENTNDSPFLDVLNGDPPHIGKPMAAGSGTVSDIHRDENTKLLTWHLPVKESCTVFNNGNLCEDVRMIGDSTLDVGRELSLRVEDENLLSMNVDGYYPGSMKWYLDPHPECGDNLSLVMQEGFRHATV